MYKLVAIDIDGTLLNSRNEITKEVNDAIQAAKENGVSVVLCTGRPIFGINPFIEELKLNNEADFAITFNGALVQNTYTEEVVSQNNLTYQDLKALYELSKEIQSPMHYFDIKHMYNPNKTINLYTIYKAFANQIPIHYRPMNETPADIVIPKAMFVDEPERLDKIIETIPDSFKEKYMMIKSTPFYLEILHPIVSKGRAIKQLAEKLSIKREEIISIGDGENDLSMIEYAGCGVAMNNATPSVKEAADFQTLSNDENGVAYAIEQLILSKSEQ
ncbi:Cof subfamily protein (haloacid dehalogenase superfamily) [Virgibacillus natechei]|uniref:Cof subfamily protein (Haloacid dehalogenase superfamily) n=1 Tax=Virgibacillus natechei TaxID=1216297 RepID=A0ABS4ICB1_9BACI|nr:sugar-phosphatase [Virgibacillus natechei]MBP1968577.1 Cof subfamily protein (haloacid dehalogenase superfamily) [Virgibacillus natechei]UZD13688.1 sugar-phosphatase [Virgibacillus natechei]